MKTLFKIAALTAAIAFWMAIPVFVVSSDLARADSADPNGPKCMCRYQGQRFNLGEYACINSRLARCEMFLNNTSWKFLEDTCPTAQMMTPLPQSMPTSPFSAAAQG